MAETTANKLVEQATSKVGILISDFWQVVAFPDWNMFPSVLMTGMLIGRSVVLILGGRAANEDRDFYREGALNMKLPIYWQH